MAWRLDGTYFENCPCDMVCPCTTSALTMPADAERCRVVLIFHIDSGEVEGVEVNGLTVAVLADTPPVMAEGNWRVGMFMDADASEEQAEKLGAVFSGQLGGPMEALGGLIGEQLGVERVAMEFESDNGHHKLTVGDKGTVEVEDVVSFGNESGEPATMTNIFHPAGSTLTIAKATETSGVSAFGIDAQNAGKSGFSHRFAWSG